MAASPKLWASSTFDEVTIFQPARPPLIWSSEAKRRARGFREERAPKFLGWFETVLRNNIASRKVLVGRRPGYVDFSLFQVVEGLAYAYPRLWARIGSEYPLVTAHRQRIAEYPALQTYFRSQRRLDFNTGGLFRHYPELDP